MDGEVSPAAAAANRRLYELRARLAAARQEAGDGRTAAVGDSHSVPSYNPFTRAQTAAPLDAATPSPTAAVIGPIATAAALFERRQGVASAEWGQPTTYSHSQSTIPPVPAPTELSVLAAAIAGLPPHLGWGSETLSAHLRKIQDTKYEIRNRNAPFNPPPTAQTTSDDHERQTTETRSPNSYFVTRNSYLVKVYPDIALGMLRAEQAAAGRVWLLLRHLDEAGRGMVALDAARAALTGKGSPLRLCGWRRLRQLLAAGEGVFWAREAGPNARPDRFRKTCQVSTRQVYEARLRLHGPARVAAALGVRRLVGRPVGVPVAALLGPIGDARAHLYATFHSGRAKETTKYEIRDTNEDEAPHSYLVSRISHLGNPIARDTLAALSGTCARTQAAYERRAGVRARPNIALGERVAATGGIGPAEQERAWRQGRALFRLKDYHGRHGRAGATYLAWRLPNGYGGGRNHTQRPKGRQKRINRQLADLFTKGMTGNGGGIEKRFYGTAAAACRAGERGSSGEKEIGDWRLAAFSRSTVADDRFVTRYWPLTTDHSPLAGLHWPLTTDHLPLTGCVIWATVGPVGGASMGGSAGEMNPAAERRNRLKPVDQPASVGTPEFAGGSAGDLFQQVLPGSGGFQSAGG